MHRHSDGTVHDHSEYDFGGELSPDDIAAIDADPHTHAGTIWHPLPGGGRQKIGKVLGHGPNLDANV